MTFHTFCGAGAVLVKLECDLSWQAQHFVTFWEIAGARNFAYFHTKCLSKMGRVRSPKRRVRDDDFMLGISSECRRSRRNVVESSLIWRKKFRDFSLKSSTQNFLAWQAQYLVSLKADRTCSAHWK